jgi:hypothetical protein
MRRAELDRVAGCVEGTEGSMTNCCLEFVVFHTKNRGAEVFIRKSEISGVSVLGGIGRIWLSGVGADDESWTVEEDTARRVIRELGWSK